MYFDILHNCVSFCCRGKSIDVLAYLEEQITWCVARTASCRSRGGDESG